MILAAPCNFWPLDYFDMVFNLRLVYASQKLINTGIGATVLFKRNGKRHYKEKCGDSWPCYEKNNYTRSIAITFIFVTLMTFCYRF